jgi:hypothetical protein
VFTSTFNNNKARSNGGAIGISNSITTTSLQDATFVGNAAGTDGGALFDSGGALILLADTINGNSAGGPSLGVGGGVCIFNGGSVSLQNTIVFGNTTGFGAADIFSLVITDNGGNLIGIAPPGFGAGTLIGVNPMLGDLEDNGRYLAGAFSEQEMVLTEALLPGSPAIGKGVTTSNLFDERGFASPASGRTKPSIGAYEPQFATTASKNQVFVENVYEVLLNRPADSTATNLVNQLNHAATPTSVVQSVENTPEYRTDQVQLLNERNLHRLAGSNEQGEINFLAMGGTLEQLAAQLVGSNEYFQLHGSNIETFIDGLYEDGLDRQPTTLELVSAEQALAGGKTRTQLALSIFTTPEALSNLVQADFQSLLGRRADPTALASFVNVLQHGGTDQLVLAQILGGTEGFAKRS